MSEEKSFLDDILESDDDEFEPVDVNEIENDEKFERGEFQFGEVESLDSDVSTSRPLVKELLPSYYSRNREAILQKSRQQRKDINQKKAEGVNIENYSQSYYKKNKEVILQKSKDNYIARKENPEVYNKYLNERKGYYLENKEKIKQKNKYKNEIFNSLISGVRK